jgi:hypothetical protein
VKKKEEESFNEGEAVDGCLECCREKKKEVTTRRKLQEESRDLAEGTF